MEGEHVNKDHRAIIEPDGSMIPNQLDTVLAQEE